MSFVCDLLSRTLPAESLDDAETVEEYTFRVQGIMANAMSVQPTPHTSADKVEYAKRKLFTPPTGIHLFHKILM